MAAAKGRAPPVYDFDHKDTRTSLSKGNSYKLLAETGEFEFCVGFDQGHSFEEPVVDDVEPHCLDVRPDPDTLYPSPLMQKDAYFCSRFRLTLMLSSSAV